MRNAVLACVQVPPVLFYPDLFVYGVIVIMTKGKTVLDRNT